ncbi:MAG: hypothetical protein OEM84_03540 [Acidimicrobiia bacterium]|nr:hypothetical protein [Acidimicrobiia bacterium]
MRSIRHEAFDGAVSILVDRSAEAARTLVALATEPHSNAPVRLGACRSVLAFANDLHRGTEIEHRIEALEERLGL